MTLTYTSEGQDEYNARKQALIDRYTERVADLLTQIDQARADLADSLYKLQTEWHEALMVGAECSKAEAHEWLWSSDLAHKKVCKHCGITRQVNIGTESA